MIFVNSMSDLFQKDIPEGEHLAAVFETMEKANWHTYQVLTKRSSLLHEVYSTTITASPTCPSPHVVRRVAGKPAGNITHRALAEGRTARCALPVD